MLGLLGDRPRGGRCIGVRLGPGRDPVSHSQLACFPPRYSFNEEEGELPEWFTEEEKQHRRKQIPLDRQTVEEYRQRWREINARPIKKVAEAKARKKRRVSGAVVLDRCSVPIADPFVPDPLLSPRC